jgi:hypothetical protein
MADRQDKVGEAAGRGWEADDTMTTSEKQRWWMRGCGTQSDWIGFECAFSSWRDADSG